MRHFQVTSKKMSLHEAACNWVVRNGHIYHPPSTNENKPCFVASL